MIDKNSQIPFYLQVKEDIVKKIKNGTFKDEDKIPSEEVLCSIYNVSRPTVRQAVKSLLNEGKLIIIKGTGTFVKKQKFESSYIYKIASFADELHQKKIPFKDQIIEFKIIKPSSEISNILEITSKNNIIYYNRLRFIEKEPLYNTRSFIIEELCPNLINEKVENQSLLHLLENKYNLDFSLIKRYLQPISATTELAQLLKIPKDTPIHYLETIILDKNNKPIAYFKDYLRGDKSKFAFEIRKNN